ncbi:cytochrome c3 family protein, partial [Bacteroidota bacterium]
LMENLLGSSHYSFHTKVHKNVYGFNGEAADDFRMGKINRPCPKPGSFAMTAWAEIVVTDHGDTLSEGCGQCHIGGQYHAPLGSMMPGYKELRKEADAIDCLICHAAAYDMNKKQVVLDEHGKRWDQDRSMLAAMSVTKTTSQTCLRCHQHNLGGDIYIDEADPTFMQSMVNTGNERPRVLHPGSKRGTPFSPSWDVHAAAGLNCTDCHTTEGHNIAKGTHTTTMMANDLPDVEVSCVNCHTAEPHNANEDIALYLNAHNEKIACVTCHIPSLHPDNVTKRDFANPVFEEEEGIYIYDDVSKETLPGKGIGYVWWNGDATFLGNPIGDNPNGAGLYRFYKPDNIWPEFESFDYEGWYEATMRPLAARKPSKLYAMKYFNGRQHIDLQNIGPFGGMYVPYNLPTYYISGDPGKAAQAEMEKSMMKMMYGKMFDIYMMDRFLDYMVADGWNTRAYKDVLNGKNVEARWLPNDAMLEISHSIRKNGALSCTDCHTSNGVLDWKALGYTEEEVEMLTMNPL